MLCTEVGIYRYDFLAIKKNPVFLRMRIDVKDVAFGRFFNKMLLRFFLRRVMFSASQVPFFVWFKTSAAIIESLTLSSLCNFLCFVWKNFFLLQKSFLYNVMKVKAAKLLNILFWNKTLRVDLGYLYSQ